jgi:hypothetical protein
MTDIFGFDLKTAAMIGGMGVAYFLLAYLPVIYSALIAFRRRPALSHRILFVLTVAAFVYGLVAFASIGISLPSAAFLSYVAPQMEASGYLKGSAFFHGLRFLAAYWWLILPPIFGVLSVVFTRFLATRWDAVVVALRS